MENQTSEPPSCEDVRKSGYLRKQKSMHRRYFVLRAASERGPARLEYYESEKKFRGKAPVPKKALALETCFNINKRADSKNKHMIVLYTRTESFAIAAETEADQDEWYQAMVELQCKSKTPIDGGAAGDYGVPNPGPAFKEVWQVKVWPKGLGQAKNLVGVYRLCLTDKTVNFVKLNSDAAAVVLQLMNVRRCGHSENFFFVEVGRSAVTGPGEFWMQVDDSVVAQNMHETLLEAMKALSEEFRQRSKSQSSAGPGGGANASNPISVPSRRHNSNPPPSQVGFARRPRTEPPGGATSGGGSSANGSPTPRHGSFPRSRTASDGGKGLSEEGAMPLAGAGSSSPTTTTPILRTKSARSASTTTGGKNPLGLMRSISTPTPSPAPNLSSSSGHGSEFGVGASAATAPSHGSFGCRPSHHRASVSGSPTDYGSSDEYGSSPGEPSPLLPSPTLAGCSLGEDEGAAYILMGQRGGPDGGPAAAPGPPGAPSSSRAPARRVLRRSSSREIEAERRLLSKRASLPPMALERLAPRQRRGTDGSGVAPDDDEDSADYAVMSRSASRESFTISSSVSSPSAGWDVAMGNGGGYLEVAVEGGVKAEGGGAGGGPVDNGYMSMLPGVTQPPSPAVCVPTNPPAPPAPTRPDDYMAMTPHSSVSPPQQIRPPPPGPDGYMMMMSPHGSCSPDQRGSGGGVNGLLLAGGAWPGSGSADSRTGSDYMNMSPISARSASGSPPPPSPEPPGAPPHPGPKMVYSYYSLPRSYKHLSSSGHFEEGRRPPGVCGAGGRRQEEEHPTTGGRGASAAGLHLSLSSSYSSSSASSESLGEGEERGAGPGRGRSRPISLLVDVSKANTLPRVRENPAVAEPKSPGEYVSIEFKGGLPGPAPAGRGGTRGRAPLRPHGSAPGQHKSFLPLSRSPSAPIAPPAAASEYVNMDLGPSPSPSPLSLTALGFPSFHSPPTPPAEALAPTEAPASPGVDEDDEEEEVVLPSVSEAGSVPPCGDYTEMAFASAPRPPVTLPPKVPSPTRPDPSVSGLPLGLDFALAKPAPNPDRGAKVIRADPQGRRRHCSETFLAPSSLPSSSSSSSSSSTASLFPEHAQAVARRLGFDAMLWANGSASDPHSQCALPGPQSLPAAQASSGEQGLNYIDLDLANKESPHSALADGASGSQAAPSRLFPVLAGGSGAGGSGSGASSMSNGGGGGGSSSSLNTYASIDFYKSEELRTHHNGSKDGTEC